MPIYEYQCTACGALFEAIQKVTESPLTHCEACGKDSAKRLVSAPGFQLKGTGWYVTDFKDKPKAGQSTTQSTSKTETSAAKKDSE